jgi:hypothetical protein
MWVKRKIMIMPRDKNINPKAVMTSPRSLVSAGASETTSSPSFNLNSHLAPHSLHLAKVSSAFREKSYE